jgi:hypothetical protein
MSVWLLPEPKRDDANSEIVLVLGLVLVLEGWVSTNLYE